MVYYRKSKTLMEATQVAREANKEESAQLRTQAVTALTQETGRGQFNRSEIQSKIVQLQKTKESDSDKPTISIVLKADVAGSLEGNSVFLRQHLTPPFVFCFFFCLLFCLFFFFLIVLF